MTRCERRVLGALSDSWSDTGHWRPSRHQPLAHSLASSPQPPTKPSPDAVYSQHCIQSHHYCSPRRPEPRAAKQKGGSLAFHFIPKLTVIHISIERNTTMSNIEMFRVDRERGWVMFATLSRGVFRCLP
jgi:hypothetical protein